MVSLGAVDPAHGDRRHRGARAGAVRAGRVGQRRGGRADEVRDRQPGVQGQPRGVRRVRPACLRERGAEAGVPSTPTSSSSTPAPSPARPRRKRAKPCARRCAPTIPPVWSSRVAPPRIEPDAFRPWPRACVSSRKAQLGARVPRVDALAATPLADTMGGPAAALGGALRTRVGVKVQDGCNNACTYCIVHVARGRATSRPAHEVVAECAALARAGVGRSCSRASTWVRSGAGRRNLDRLVRLA